MLTLWAVWGSNEMSVKHLAQSLGKRQGMGKETLKNIYTYSYLKGRLYKQVQWRKYKLSFIFSIPKYHYYYFFFLAFYQGIV